MKPSNRRLTEWPDRRRVARGGRREADRAGRHPTILLADGYDDARFPVARYLDRYGFEVLEAGSAAEALAILDRRRPHAVLSGLRGPEAARLQERLSRPAAGACVVIALLSHPEDLVPVQATAVLSKPFTLRSMLDELRQELVLEGSRTRAAESS